MNSKLFSYYFNILKSSLKRFKFNFKNFGMKLAILNFCGEIAYFKLFNGSKISNVVIGKQESAVYGALEKKYADLIEEYKDKEIEIGKNGKKIWFMRWEGIRDDNIVVKKCYDSIKKYSGDYELVVITEDNYAEHVEIPQVIINKVNEGAISLTHLSDIMRCQLLSKHGGVWADSTMLFFDNVFDEFDECIFNGPSVGGAKWCTFFMGGKPNKLFSFTSDLLVRYFSEYDEIINYFLLDQSITLAYNNFKECRAYIDESAMVNDNVFYFINHFPDTYVKEEFDKICMENRYFKISDKASVNAKLHDADGNLTNYGYFIKELEF